MRFATLAAFFATTADAAVNPVFDAAWKSFYKDQTEATRAEIENTLSTNDLNFEWAIAN